MSRYIRCSAFFDESVNVNAARAVGGGAHGHGIACLLHLPDKLLYVFVQLRAGAVQRKGHKLISANAVAVLFPKDLPQDAGHGAEHLVSLLVAVGVVQLMEAVDVDVNTGEAVAAPERVIPQAVLVGIAVVQPGVEVAFRHGSQLAAGDKVAVHHAHDKGRHNAGDGPEHQRVADIHGDDPPVLEAGDADQKNAVEQQHIGNVQDGPHHKQHRHIEQKRKKRGSALIRGLHRAQVNAQTIDHGSKGVDLPV